MGYPPPHPDQPYSQQPYSQPSGPHYPVPYGQPHYPAPGPQYMPVQMVTVKERGFNPVTFGIHACLWVFLHWWLALLTIGFWLIIAIPVSFIGWRVKRTVPVQQVQRPPHPPYYG